jgi:hypothetical protein
MLAVPDPEDRIAVDGIFISYRRDDSAGYAGRLYDRLAAHFGVDRVFMDVEGIEPGTDFVVAIEKAVASCRVLIVLIGDEWLEATDAAGRRRLDDPHDFIRLETRAALARDIRVVPVLLDGAAMPRADALPEDLQALVRRQAVELTHKQWDATSGELIRTLEKILATGTPEDTPAPPAQAPTPTIMPTPPPAVHHPPARGRLPVWLLGVGVAGLAIAGWLLSSLSFEGEGRVSVSPQQVDGSAQVKVDRQPGPATAPSEAPAGPAEAPAAPRLAGGAAALDFGGLTLGEAKGLEWRLLNLGGAEPGVRLELTGPDAAQFRMPVETCTGGVGADGQCSVSLSYQPRSAGSHRATLVARGSANQVELALSGSARAAAPPTPAPAPSPAPAPDKPEILTLAATPQAGAARICYRVEGAQSVVIEPGGGRMDNPARDCVTIALDTATTLTLTASNAGGTVRRQVRAAPEPPPAPTADDRLPSPGDTWVYRSRGKWGNSPRRTVSVTVERIEDGLIYETMTQLEPDRRGGGTRRSRNGAPGFVDWTWLGWEFAPWFVTSEAIRAGQWSDIPTPEMSGGWGNWTTGAKVADRGEISVAAGTFKTIEVQVWAKRHATGGSTLADQEPTDVRLRIWYSPQAKRYVKMERIIKSASSLEAERDLIELIEYRTR